MTATTQPGVAQNVTPVQSAPADTVDQFQGLWDASVAAENAPPAQTENERPDTENAATDAEVAGEQPEQAPEQAETGAADEKSGKSEPETNAAPDAKTYSSLDEYLKAQKLDPQSFMTLPVTVKVDGKEQSVPLSEALKGYQLSTASYARMEEAAKQRQQFADEQSRTRQAFTHEQQNVRQALGVRIHQVETLAKTAEDILLSEYHQLMNSPQWAQMSSGDQAMVHFATQQKQNQIKQLMQQAATAKQQEAEQAKQARLQALPAERDRLLQARPEWRDLEKANAAQKSMFDLGRKMGFSDVELQDVQDYRHLLVLDEAAQYQPLKAVAAKLGVSTTELANMAEQYAKLKSQIPSKLQRVQAAPKMAAPGTRQVRDPKAVALQNARKAWDANPRSEDAAAAVFEQFV